ncbi:MAG: hypothetical protein KJ578_15790 [Bacteroidetes bacterium]|nr:hypothetical protein [Bacteroidota bacterium]
MSTVHTYGVVAADIAVRFADYPEGFTAATLPTAVQVGALITSMSSEVTGALYAQGLDPTTVEADAHAISWCAETLILGVSWQVSLLLRGISANRNNPYREQYEKRLQQLQLTPTCLGDAGGGQVLLTTDMLNPDVGVNVHYDFLRSERDKWL